LVLAAFGGFAEDAILPRGDPRSPRLVARVRYSASGDLPYPHLRRLPPAATAPPEPHPAGEL